MVTGVQTCALPIYLHVILAIDRAGLVGADGKTHQGCFDISYLSMLPNMTIMAPKNKWELSDMMKFAVGCKGPVAIRYPRGAAYTGLEEHREEIGTGKAEVTRRGSRIAILALGNMVKEGVKVADALAEEGLEPTLVNLRFAKPFDKELLRELAADHELYVTMEENVRNGGLGEHILAFLNEEGIQVDTRIIAVPDQYMRHAGVDAQMRAAGIDAASVLNQIHSWLEEK